MIILYNNKFITNATIPTTSKSFMYGYGVFETLRTYNRQVFKADEHIERLFQSARIIGLSIDYSKDEIKKMLEKIAAQWCPTPYRVSDTFRPEQRIKIIATEGGIIITADGLKIDPAVYNGVSVKSIECVRPFPEAKKLAYLDSYLTHQQAVDDSYYDALLIDEKEEIYEGAYSNIFWFEDDTLCTRKDKVLPGITRQTIIDISPFPVKYKTITLDKLIQKKAIFLTQTTTGVVPIVKIDESVINGGVVDEKVLRVMEVFNNHIIVNKQKIVL